MGSTSGTGTGARRRATLSRATLVTGWCQNITPFNVLRVLGLLPRRAGTTLHLDHVAPKAALLHMLRCRKLPVLRACR